MAAPTIYAAAQAAWRTNPRWYAVAAADRILTDSTTGRASQVSGQSGLVESEHLVEAAGDGREGDVDAIPGVDRIQMRQRARCVALCAS